MKWAIRVLAIADLILFFLDASISFYEKACGSLLTCIRGDRISQTVSGIEPSAQATLMIFLGALPIALAIVVATLSIALHNSRRSLVWFWTFVILTSLLVLSPATIALGLGFRYALYLAATSSLLAFVSTFEREANAIS